MAAIIKKGCNLRLLLWNKTRIASNLIRFKHVDGKSISSILSDHPIGSTVNVKVTINFIFVA